MSVAVMVGHCSADRFRGNRNVTSDDPPLEHGGRKFSRSVQVVVHQVTVCRDNDALAWATEV